MSTGKLFVDYPECIDNHTKLKGFLTDFYQTDKRKINTVLAAYDTGIIEAIQCASELDEFLEERFVKTLCRDYGMEVNIAKEAVEFWFTEYGVSALNKVYNVPKNKQQNNNEKKTDNQQKKQTVSKTGRNNSKKKSTARPEKHGFDSKTNDIYVFADYSVEVPRYWKSERKINGGFQRYAETNGKVAMLQVESQKETDPSYPVTFEGLINDNENMIKTIKASLFHEVTGYEVIDTGIIKGILYSGTIEAANLKGYGEWFTFGSEKKRIWCTVIMCQSDNTKYSYRDDFRKIIDSIKRA